MKLLIGFDRYIPKRWADNALDIYLYPSKYENGQIETWISQEVTGKETARKIASQLHKLWLNPQMPCEILRQRVKELNISEGQINRSILHYGMALNVFPLLRDTSIAIGRLTSLHGQCTRQEVLQRVVEKYGNPVSLPRAIYRVFQTLEDWALLKSEDNHVVVTECLLEDKALQTWFIEALVLSRPSGRVALPELAQAPENLGIRVNDLRACLRASPTLQLLNEGGYAEVVQHTWATAA